MSQGWISIHRQFKEWEWYGDSKIVHLFLHCLMSANHKPKQWRGRQIEAGQFITSQSHLSQDTGLSVRQVRTILDKLKLTGELTVQITNKFSIISITNWDKFQGVDRQDVSQVTTKRQASDNQLTTNNNDNNANNVNNDNKKPVPAKKKKQQGIIAIEYLDGLNKEAWLMWIEHRREAKIKKLTPRGENIAIKQLIAMGNHAEQLLIIEKSIGSSYTGLRPRVWLPSFLLLLWLFL